MSDTEIRSRLNSRISTRAMPAWRCHRIRHTHHVACSFLRYCGLSLW
jgi:hypothetical protein